MSAVSEPSLRVGLLNFGFWPEIQRGSERIVHDLATDLVLLGHRPELITSHPRPTTRSTEDGVTIIRHWRPPEAPLRLRRFHEHLTHLPFSYLSLRRGDYDVADAFHPSDAVASTEWARRTGRPAVLSFTGIPQREAISNLRLRMRILERATTSSDAVVVLSKAAQEGMWRWLGVESQVIYPGVNLDSFTPGDGRAEHPTVACAASSEDGRKRIGLLLRAFRIVRREIPHARLLLMRPSSPDLARELTEAVEGVELFEPDVRGVRSVFREAWTSGLTSYQEAFGLVLVESLACGTPVFASHDGGVPEIVDDDAVGRLFQGDDEHAVARAILETLQLSSDPATSAACRARAERFSTLSGARAYESLYRELLTAS